MKCFAVNHRFRTHHFPELQCIDLRNLSRFAKRTCGKFDVGNPEIRAGGNALSGQVRHNHARGYIYPELLIAVDSPEWQNHHVRFYRRQHGEITLLVGFHPGRGRDGGLDFVVYRIAHPDGSRRRLLPGDRIGCGPLHDIVTEKIESPGGNCECHQQTD